MVDSFDSFTNLEDAFVPMDFPADSAPRRDPEVGRRLGDEIAEISSQISAAQQRKLTKLRRFDEEGWWGDQGAKSASHWLRWRLGLGKSTADDWVRIAHALARLPKTDDVFRRGVLSYTQVRAITRIATPENEATLIQFARHATGSQLVKICGEVRRQLALTAQPDLEHALRLAFRTLDDGSEELTACMRPEQAAIVRKAIDVEQREARTDPPAPASASTDDAAHAEPAVPDRPTFGRRDRAADVYSLVRVCERFLASARSNNKPGAFEVLVAVDLETLRNTDGSVVWRSELLDGTQLTPDTARRLTCDCPLVPMILKPDGTPIDVGRRTRVVPAALSRALLLRDRRCTYPGCDSRAADAHHIQHWAQGGETNLDNLTLLCERHHTWVHEGGYQIVRGEDGSLNFVDPSGEVVPRSDLREVPEDVLELLRAQSSAAGLVIDASTNMSKYDGTHRPDIGACIGAVLDRTVGSRFYYQPRHGRVEVEVA